MLVSKNCLLILSNKPIVVLHNIITTINTPSTTRLQHREQEHLKLLLLLPPLLRHLLLHRKQPQEHRQLLSLQAAILNRSLFRSGDIRGVRILSFTASFCEPGRSGQREGVSVLYLYRPKLTPDCLWRGQVRAIETCWVDQQVAVYMRRYGVDIQWPKSCGPSRVDMVGGCYAGGRSSSVLCRNGRASPWRNKET